MTNLGFLQFCVDYWKEIGEDADAIAIELDQYEGNHRLMANDYASDIADDKDEWNAEWIEKAEYVMDQVTYQECEEAKILLSPLGK